VSNLLDRLLRHGLVTDFITIRIGPFHSGIFNAADVLIVIGTAVIVYGFRRTSALLSPPNSKPRITNGRKF
jgi:signal peptidase II